MKTKLLALTAVSAVLFSTSSLAAPVLGFNPLGTGAGGYIYADTWNYATDRGVDVGDQNFVVGGNVGDAHSFHTQMAINSFQRNGNTIGVNNLNTEPTGFEITKELTVIDTVTGVTAGTNGVTVGFAGGENTSAVLNIYVDYYNQGGVDASKQNGGVNPAVACYGTNGNGNCAVGTDQTGFGGGANIGPILTAHQLSTNSSFNNPNPGVGDIGTGSFTVTWVIDSWNSNYIDVSNLLINGGTGAPIFTDIMDGTLTQPATQFPIEMWDATTPGDPNSSLFDITGRQVFGSVPEPTSLALLGAGLLLSGYRKRMQA